MDTTALLLCIYEDFQQRQLQGRYISIGGTSVLLSESLAACLVVVEWKCLKGRFCPLMTMHRVLASMTVNPVISEEQSRIDTVTRISLAHSPHVQGKHS